MTQYRGIAIVGNKHVGKSTLARHLEANYLVKRVHPKLIFGGMVTPIMLKMGVPIDELEPRIFGERIEDPLPAPFAHRTTRHLLQAAGGGFLDDFGVEDLAHTLTAPPPTTMGLIESVRRVEEAEWLRAQGWCLIRIARPSLGGHTGEHATEVDLSGIPVHEEIVNDDSLEVMLSRGRGVMVRHLDMVEAHRRHALLVLNGRPLVGKDELTRMLGERCRELNIGFGFFSSIQPVKDMYAAAGIDTSQKTAEDRDLLAGTKQALRAHGDWPNRWVLDAWRHLRTERENVLRRTLLVTHVREAEDILRLCEHRDVVSCWMLRAGARDSGATNAGDRATAGEMDYDLIVNNSGTIEELAQQSGKILRRVFA